MQEDKIKIHSTVRVADASHTPLSSASKKRNKSFTVTTPSQVPSLVTHTSVWVRVCTRPIVFVNRHQTIQCLANQPFQIWRRHSATIPFCGTCAVRCAQMPAPMNHVNEPIRDSDSAHEQIYPPTRTGEIMHQRRRWGVGLCRHDKESIHLCLRG